MRESDLIKIGENIIIKIKKGNGVNQFKIFIDAPKEIGVELVKEVKIETTRV